MRWPASPHDGPRGSRDRTHGAPLARALAHGAAGGARGRVLARRHQLRHVGQSDRARAAGRRGGPARARADADHHHRRHRPLGRRAHGSRGGGIRPRVARRRAARLDGRGGRARHRRSGRCAERAARSRGSPSRRCSSRSGRCRCSAGWRKGSRAASDFVSGFPSSFLWIGQSVSSGAPPQAFTLAAVALVFAHLLHRTIYGRGWYAIGWSLKAHGTRVSRSVAGWRCSTCSRGSSPGARRSCTSRAPARPRRTRAPGTS